MAVFARYSEKTIAEMRDLVARQDWPGFRAVVLRFRERAEGDGLYSYGVDDRAYLGLFLNGEVRAGLITEEESLKRLAGYDNFLGGTKLKDPRKYFSRFMSNQRRLGRPSYVVVKRSEEAAFPPDARVLEV